METAAQVIARLGLQPHPEGGHYRETFRSEACTQIFYLLAAGERSHWHKVDRVEIWHWYAGAALELGLAPPAGAGRSYVRLGNRLDENESPNAVVPPDWWQAARSLGEWTLVGCTVSPAFSFAGFELAPPRWEPHA